MAAVLVGLMLVLLLDKEMDNEGEPKDLVENALPEGLFRPAPDPFPPPFMPCTPNSSVPRSDLKELVVELTVDPSGLPPWL